MRPLIAFTRRVLSRFIANKGLLLAGGMAWNMLLSLVPLVAVILLIVSTVIERARIVATVQAELKLLIPSHATLITDAVVDFLDDRGVVGGVLFAALLFFSSFAFRMLEDAFHLIFHDPARPIKRRFWVSATLPYAFIGVITVLLLFVTAGTAALDTLSAEHATVLGVELHWSAASVWLLRGSGFVGLVLLFSSLYLVFPARRIAPRRALVGGLLTAVLWQATRNVLVYYFEHISVVNVVYGSLATVVVALLTMEVASVIILLGAQVISLLEHHADEGLPWHGQQASSGAPRD
ncbi:MAG: YihY/virulence factor BrkB family protein [Myxococcales bacterium]|nr:YihY/virulence factor BrkB family protein [Myxococcales bacterium]